MAGQGSPSVCIVGVGATTPVGYSAPAAAAAIRAGIDGFHEHPYLIDREGEPFVVAAPPFMPEDLAIEERLIEMALPAAYEALDTLSDLAPAIRNLPTYIGLPEWRTDLVLDTKKMISALSGQLNLKSSQVAVVQAYPMGHAAGFSALAAAGQQLQQRQCEFCLIGGMDSYQDPDVLYCIYDNDQLHHPMNAYGFVPGEAAGFCLLTLPQTAQRYQMPILGEIKAVATSVERNRIKTDTICLGEGLSQCIGEVLNQLPDPEAQIEYTICDLNGEPYRADEFGFTMARHSQRFVDPSDFLAPADCWGDVGAASGPLFLVLLAQAQLRGYTKGRYNIIWASSEGGERAAALVETNPHSLWRN